MSEVYSQAELAMPRDTSTQTDPLIQEIRDRYAYASKEWKEIREEAEIDMRYVSGNPWSDEDLKQREDTGRPALSPDELTQYTNQAINNFRQNQIGIKVNPAGDGATDQTAQANQALIRGIEYDSNAQRSAYTPAFQNALERSYGFFEITRKFMPKSFNQKIIIKGIPNPNLILYDPDVLEADWSDARYVFKLSPLTKAEFKRKYPKAKVQDFSPEDMRGAKDWITEDSVLTAAYWKREKVEKQLLLIETPEGDSTFYEDELPEGMKGKLKIIKERMDETYKVTQYVTNGIEILETLPQPGVYIPIIPVIGKEMYIPEGGKSKRVILSLVRLARDPYMTYCYLWSQMAEQAKLVPKTKIMGAVGQFETDKEAWDNLTSQPRAYVQYDPIPDSVGGQAIEKPDIISFSPNFSEFITAQDAAKRAIQAAMGINPLPTPAQRQNEKSGVALQKIQQQESVGSFHFTDNIHRALEFAGRVIESWIPVVYDTQREAGIRMDDGTHKVVKLNTPEPYLDDEQKEQHFPVSDDGKPYGAHQIEITTGPSFQSQRDEANDFLNTIIPNIEQLPLEPAVKAQFLALVIKMKNFGPLGDQMAALLDGTSDPQQLQAKLGQLQQSAQQSQEIIQQLQAELQKLQFEKQAKLVEMQGRAEIVKMQEENKLAIAEVSTKAQQISERLETFADMMKQFHQQAHDSALSAQEHAQNTQAAAQQHEQALQQGDQAAQNQVAVAAGQPQEAGE